MKPLQALTAAALAALLLAGCAGEPSSSAAAEPTPTPTVEPTPEPTPALTLDPLTGKERDDCGGQRPVAVSIRTGDGAAPQWGISRAGLIIEGVTEGRTAGMTAVFSCASDVEKAGPVGPGRDLPLQLTLPLNAIPVHINKNIYASNLLNALTYQDLDGYHIGKAAFAFDEERAAAGFREENCWYTTGDLIAAGLSAYGMDTTGNNMTLFSFGERSAPESCTAKNLRITFSDEDAEELVFDPDTRLYFKYHADGSPVMDAAAGEQVVFSNVFVLYASSGIKDDGVTRQYDLTGGTGIYLTDGAWETIGWTKGDATAPLSLTDAGGKTLTVSPGQSLIVIYGGYYGQSLRLTDADGNEQTLPEKPALLENGIPDEVAAQAEMAEKIEDAKAAYDAAAAELAALQEQQPDPADAEAAQKLADAQAAFDKAAAELAALAEQQENTADAAPAE